MTLKKQLKQIHKFANKNKILPQKHQFCQKMSNNWSMPKIDAHLKELNIKL